MKTKIILFLLSTVIIIGSCKKKEEYIDLNLSGTINGHVEHVYAEFEGEVSKKDVIVEIIGLSISTTTDEEGRFSLTNVPTGTYDLKFYRSDVGIYEYHDVEIVGGEAPIVIKDEINLIQKSTTTISSITAVPGAYEIFLSAEIEQDDNLHRKIVFFVSKSNNVYPPSNPQTGDPEYLIRSYNLYSDEGYLSVPIRSDWRSDTIFIKAYGASDKWLYTYTDYTSRTTGQVVYPGVNYEAASETVSLILTKNN